jgi:predicted RNase H-like HicB family nuclease
LDQSRDLDYAECMPDSVTTVAQFLAGVMAKAQLEQLESGEWFASIPEFVGVWATGATEAAAREELKEVIIEWVRLRSLESLERNQARARSARTPHSRPKGQRLSSAMVSRFLDSQNKRDKA